MPHFKYMNNCFRIATSGNYLTFLLQNIYGIKYNEMRGKTLFYKNPFINLINLLNMMKRAVIS